MSITSRLKRAGKQLSDAQKKQIKIIKPSLKKARTNLKKLGDAEHKKKYAEYGKTIQKYQEKARKYSENMETDNGLFDKPKKTKGKFILPEGEFSFGGSWDRQNEKDFLRYNKPRKKKKDMFDW